MQARPHHLILWQGVPQVNGTLSQQTGRSLGQTLLPSSSPEAVPVQRLRALPRKRVEESPSGVPPARRRRTCPARAAGQRGGAGARARRPLIGRRQPPNRKERCCEAQSSGGDGTRKPRRSVGGSKARLPGDAPFFLGAEVVVRLPPPPEGGRRGGTRSPSRLLGRGRGRCAGGALGTCWEGRDGDLRRLAPPCEETHSETHPAFPAPHLASDPPPLGGP